MSNPEATGGCSPFQDQRLGRCLKNRPTLKVRRRSGFGEAVHVFVAIMHHKGRGRKPLETCPSARCLGRERLVVLRPTGASQRFGPSARTASEQSSSSIGSIKALASRTPGLGGACTRRNRSGLVWVAQLTPSYVLTGAVPRHPAPATSTRSRTRRSGPPPGASPSDSPAF
jgi:hypothetical protein